MNSETSIILLFSGGKNTFFWSRQAKRTLLCLSLNKADICSGFDAAASQVTNFSALSTALFHLSYHNPINSSLGTEIPF